MDRFQLKMTYVGGPTAVLDWCGQRFLTDPTFDPPGEYPAGAYTLRKTMGPVLSPDNIGHIDYVLLSHDHHLDNLDHSGRSFLSKSGRVLTTPEGAGRLGGNATGLGAWEYIESSTSDGHILRVTATPARHGPEGGDRGPVTGFILSVSGCQKSVYVSGDTVWYEGVEEVAKRYPIGTAILFMGAAKVAAAGPSHLTFSAAEAVAFARHCPSATIVALHYEGWQHFSESRDTVERAFSEAGLSSRLQWLAPGREVEVARG